MNKMGIIALYPKPRISRPGEPEKKYPYLLRDLEITHANQVWSSDITYVPLNKGFIYLVAVMDWYSRYILSWEVSNTLEVDFCVEALEKAFTFGKPEIFNTDQGSQYTCKQFTSQLINREILVSWDGRGRALDNVFIERIWRSYKYEKLYPESPGDVKSAINGIEEYFNFYNEERIHQSLNYLTPCDVYHRKKLYIKKEVC